MLQRFLGIFSLELQLQKSTHFCNCSNGQILTARQYTWPQRKEYEMKSLKKVAPIMATGLVVAGFGTVDAFAADTVDTPAPPAPPAEVEKQAAPAPSTEIKSVTPTST